MSEQSYLKAPSSANARVDIAGVEGSLEFISENIGNEWCTMEDVKRLVTRPTRPLNWGASGVAGRRGGAHRMGQSGAHRMGQKVIKKLISKSLSTKDLGRARWGPGSNSLIVKDLQLIKFDISIQKTPPASARR